VDEKTCSACGGSGWVEEDEVKMAKLILTPWEKICVRDSLHFNRKEMRR